MPSPEAVVAKLRAIPEYADAFQKRVRPRARPTTTWPRHRRLRAHAVRRRRAVRPLHRRATRRRSTPPPSAAGRCSTARAAASTCHAGNAVNPLFSDQKFHNIGVAAHKQDFVQLARKARCRSSAPATQKQIDELAHRDASSRELGRFLVTKQTNDVGALQDAHAAQHRRHRALHARRLAGHAVGRDGPLQQGRRANPYLDGGMQRLGLTETEIDDLVAFLAVAHRATASPPSASRSWRGRRALQDHAPRSATTPSPSARRATSGDVAPDPDLKIKNRRPDGRRLRRTTAAARGAWPWASRASRPSTWRSATRSSAAARPVDRRAFLKVAGDLRRRGRRQGAGHRRTRSSWSTSRTREPTARPSFTLRVHLRHASVRADAQRPLRALASSRRSTTSTRSTRSRTSCSSAATSRSSGSRRSSSSARRSSRASRRR